MASFWNHITINPKILGGKPIIKGTRIPISIILQMIRDGVTFEKIIQEYPRITREDIKAVIEYSLYLVNHEDDIEEIPLTGNE